MRRDRLYQVPPRFGAHLGRILFPVRCMFSAIGGPGLVVLPLGAVSDAFFAGRLLVLSLSSPPCPPIGRF
ncbi:hypothetical protein GQ54DRAFT_77583 [Martensiomyces pterosporus]|nr:hypothetical protein GQ54DRAFT_77583 [Martensiomyces pterosporus]